MKALVISLIWLLACGVDSVPRESNPPDDSVDEEGEQPTEGGAIYAMRCMGCHGADGAGTMKAPQILSPVIPYATYVVKNGRDKEMGFPGKMPSFGDRMSDEQIDAALKWLAAPAKPSEGAALYARFCGNCHGADAGGGRVAKALAKPEVSASRVLRRVRNGAGGTAFGDREMFMPSWTSEQLTDAEVMLIAAHLASLKPTDPTDPPPTQQLVLNEVDYDQVGADHAEYIEIYNPSSAAVSLAGKQIVLVNGSSGALYQTIDLGTGSLAAGGYLVIASANVTVSDPATKLDPGWASDNLQNGAPDGIALVDNTTHTLIDALSYEGGLTAVTLPGFAGPVSLVSGTVLPVTIADSNTVDGALMRKPNGQDTNNDAADWVFGARSPGLANQ